EPRVTLALLKLLTAMLGDPARSWYGLELSRAAGLSGGTIYPLLARLEAVRWLESEWEDVDPAAAGRPQRRLYRFTRAGAEQAKALHLAHIQSLDLAAAVPGRQVPGKDLA